MKRFMCFLAGVILFFPVLAPAQNNVPYCTTVTQVDSSGLVRVQQLVNTTKQLALILVDFQDSRKPDGSLPTVDADTVYFPGDSINAVGSMGWVKVFVPPNDTVFRKKIRKYTYEDYWNEVFSNGTYYDDSSLNIHPHPDFYSHGIKVYGSMRDYYAEVSYGNFLIVPPMTHAGTQDMYHTGIVNRIDTANGKHYVHWIKLPHPRSFYKDGSDSSVALLYDPINQLRTLHALPDSNPEFIEFNPDTFKGTYSIVAAGSNIGGFTYIGYYSYTAPEKWHWIPNADYHSTFDGILTHVHEFGHTLGLPHVMLGSFDPMHWGGLALGFNYCPPHFNPLTKIQFGWIPYANVKRINTNVTSVSLRPSHLAPSGTQPTTALITIYGEAGRDSNITHSEYFAVEYRTRSGFNRFTGGTQLPANSGFSGGVLIWHYSSLAAFPYPDSDDIMHYLSIEVPGYGPSYPHGKDQAPTDYYTPGSVLDSVTEYPNSNAVIGLKTGISVKNFSFTAGNIAFDVAYQLGAPPSYDLLYGVDPTPPTVSGRVFEGGPVVWGDDLVISPGTTWDFVGSTNVRISGLKFMATGGSGPNDSIIFQGAGYGPYHNTWGKCDQWGVPTTMAITLFPRMSPDSVRIQNCVFKDVSGGIVMNLSRYQRLLATAPRSRESFPLRTSRSCFHRSNLF